MNSNKIFLIFFLFAQNGIVAGNFEVKKAAKFFSFLVTVEKINYYKKMSENSLASLIKKTNEIYELLQKNPHKQSKQPDCVKNCTLFPYQLAGLNWLISLFDNNINGILGDEMGLGKTLQSLSILGYLFENRKVTGPFLIIAPLSTMDNWDSEVKKFIPSLKPLLYIGNKNERENIRQEIVNHILKQPHEQRKDPKLFFDVLITTYDLIIHDFDFLSKFIWRYCIIDEAHRLKNIKSVLVQVILFIYYFIYNLIG